MIVQKILMVLTSHRLDCFRLCMDLVLRANPCAFFDRVVLLLNGVGGRHLRYVEQLRRLHPAIPWDIIAGPRGRGRFISNLQNECIRRYPDALYFKIDEDTFVSRDWAQRLLAAYEKHSSDAGLSLLTPIIPNNGLGWDYLLNAFADVRREYESMFQEPVSPAFDGPVWINPHIAEWITRKFINMDEANEKIRILKNREPYIRFARRFSINCLCYDYRHWKELGEIPEYDEVGWGDWIVAHNKYALLVTDTLVHHYSFFVQQDWLDRSSLLEDLRRSNLPETAPSALTAMFHRFVRIAQQTPRVIKRRLGLKNG